MKVFNELTEEELKELEESLYKRAVEKNRATLWDVVCVIREG